MPATSAADVRQPEWWESPTEPSTLGEGSAEGPEDAEDGFSQVGPPVAGSAEGPSTVPATPAAGADVRQPDTEPRMPGEGSAEGPEDAEDGISQASRSVAVSMEEADAAKAIKPLDSYVLVEKTNVLAAATDLPKQAKLELPQPDTFVTHTAGEHRGGGCCQGDRASGLLCAGADGYIDG